MNTLIKALVSFGLVYTACQSPSVLASASQDVDAAFSQLVDGRSYLKDFPKQKARQQLIVDYLGSDTNGVYLGGVGKFDLLKNAVDMAVEVRNTEPVDSSEARNAQYIAWEGLEALMSGQLYAGNADLLNGLRVAFPLPGGELPGASRPLPKGLPTMAAGKEYPGANLINLGYARLHFLRGIATVLDFMSLDREGRLRIVDYLTYPEVKNYTAFNNTNFLDAPRFADANFVGKQGLQTAGYLYGNLVNRFGMSNVNLADRLWHAAFFNANNKPLRGQMLQQASSELRKSVHAEFLAVLPLAAELSDGNQVSADGMVSENEFQIARLEQVRSSVADAVVLMEKINSGEAPKLSAFNLNASDTDIQNSINSTANIIGALENAHNTAKTEIQRLESANAMKAGDVSSMRTQFEDEMIRICGLDPRDANYEGLRTPRGRQAYRETIQAIYDQRLKAGLSSADLVDGSEMGKAALNILRAFNDIEVAKVEIDSIPQQIQIEEERNNEVNSQITSSGKKMAAMDIAIGIARSYFPSVSTGTPVSLSYDTGSSVIGFMEAAKELITVNRETSLNNINSRATVRNLLLRQYELAQRMPSTVAQAQLAIAEYNSLHKRLSRLVDNHVFFQENTQDLWYNDPSVIFEQCKAEIAYQEALQASIIQLYQLSQKLATRWAEPFENPVSFREGAIRKNKTLGPEDYSDFTESESAFNIANHFMAKKFYRALNAWSLFMAENRPSTIGPDPSTTFSLRQDIIGLSDYLWDTNTLSFRSDAVKNERNIQLFRAHLLNSQKENAPKNLFELAFGINYFTPKKSLGSALTSLLLPERDGEWNHRLKTISAKVLGNNVTAGTSVPFTLFQYGRVYSQGFFTRREESHVDNLPLYYSDPRTLPQGVPWEGRNQFALNAVIGNVQAKVTDLTGRGFSPFCDNYLLVIESSALTAPVNLQNITDIEFTFEWSVGGAPSYSWPAVQ